MISFRNLNTSNEQIGSRLDIGEISARDNLETLTCLHCDFKWIKGLLTFLLFGYAVLYSCTKL